LEGLGYLNPIAQSHPYRLASCWVYPVGGNSRSQRVRKQEVGYLILSFSHLHYYAVALAAAVSTRLLPQRINSRQVLLIAADLGEVMASCYYWFLSASLVVFLTLLLFSK
jgi:hypothetical protein